MSQVFLFLCQNPNLLFDQLFLSVLNTLELTVDAPSLSLVLSEEELLRNAVAAVDVVGTAVAGGN